MAQKLNKSLYLKKYSFSNLLICSTVNTNCDTKRKYIFKKGDNIAMQMIDLDVTLEPEGEQTLV